MTSWTSDADRQEPEGLRALCQRCPKDFVCGVDDGIITTFSVVAGVAGAQLEARIVLILGFVHLLVDGSSMGPGNALSIRSDEAVRRAAGPAAADPFP